MSVRLSVLIPACDVASYVGACLDSVLRQECGCSMEVVVCVDSRSTDATAAIVAEYAARDSRVRLCRGQARGVGQVRNLTLRQARGELLMFVDADDLLPPGAISTLLEAMTGEVDAVFGRHEEGREPGRRASADTLRHLGGEEAAVAMLYQRHQARGLHCSLWAKIWRADLWRGVTIPGNILYEDLATVPLVTARCREVAVVDRVVYHYRRRTGSSLRTFSPLRFTSVEAAAMLVAAAPSQTFARAARVRQLAAAFNVVRLMMRHRRLITRPLRRQGWRLVSPVIRRQRRQALTDRRARRSLRLAALMSYLTV